MRVGYLILLLEHLETYRLPIPKANDGTVELERAHDLQRELPVRQVIDAKELIPAIY